MTITLISTGFQPWWFISSVWSLLHHSQRKQCVFKDGRLSRNIDWGDKLGVNCTILLWIYIVSTQTHTAQRCDWMWKRLRWPDKWVHLRTDKWMHKWTDRQIMAKTNTGGYMFRAWPSVSHWLMDGQIIEWTPQIWTIVLLLKLNSSESAVAPNQQLPMRIFIYSFILFSEWMVLS